MKKIKNTDLDKIIKKPSYMNIYKNKTGYDFRNDTIENCNYTVLDFIRKKEFLTKLQSNNISIFEKMHIIDLLNTEKGYISNITNGGLLESNWNEYF